jgi:integrase
MLSGGARVDLVSKMLGHSKPSITLDIYAHLLPGDQEQAVQMLDRAFSVSIPAPATADVVN